MMKNSELRIENSELRKEKKSKEKEVRKMRRLIGLGIGILLVGVLSSALFAWGDGFTLTITPTGDRGVVIDSSTVNLSLGDIGVGTSTRTVSAISVISTGTVANIEYNIKGDVTGADPANLSTDLTPTISELLLQVQFNSTDPGDGGYVLDDVVDDTAQSAGDGAPGFFEGDEDVDGLDLYQTRNLWCRIELPAQVNYSDVQSIAVTITAEPGE